MARIHFVMQWILEHFFFFFIKYIEISKVVGKYVDKNLKNVFDYSNILQYTFFVLQIFIFLK